jgi:hypothetical protein
MLEKRNNQGESGWIAEEIFEDAELKMHSKCLAVDDQVARGVLLIDEALDIYEVSLEDYLNFYIKEQSAQAEVRFHAKSPMFQALLNVKYMNTYFHEMSPSIDSDLIVRIGDDMDKLEDDVEQGRAKLLSE